MNIEFDWDENKAESNLIKHKISFDEAKTVFYDFYAFIFDDVKHSISEKRELIIGYSISKRLLIVSFTLRNGKIRIISSRLTDKYERYEYEQNKLKKEKHN
jgi:uncharacterized protein